MRFHWPLRIVPLLLLATVHQPAMAQRLPTVPSEDYARWETLGDASLSPYGRWVVYTITRVDETGELRLRMVERDSVQVVPWGQAPRFAPNSRWVAWAAGVPTEERERLEDADEPIHLGAGVLDLTTGRERSFGEVEQFAFDADGRYLAMQGYAPDEPEGKGADVRLLDLTTGQTITFGNVAEMQWSDRGSLLALALATGADAGNGIQVYDAASGRLQSLDASGSAYRGLSWREDSADLAALRTLESASDSGSAHVLLAWRGLGTAVSRLELSPADAGVSDTLEVSGHGRLEWSDDGRMIAFGLRGVVREDADSTASDSTGADDRDEELPAVQIWHTRDVRVFPQQRAAESRDDRRTLLAVWHLETGRVVQVGTELLADTEIIEGWEHAMEATSQPYGWGEMFGRPYRDVRTVDLETGRRTLALERVRHFSVSAGGRYLLWFDGTDYWTRELASGRTVNVTEALPATFADTAFDTPTDLLPPHGHGGWMADDAAVLLYDAFDVWSVAPDGTGGRRVTDGADERIVHRVVDLDDDGNGFDPNRDLYLSLRGERTARRGYARVRPGAQRPERLAYEDRLVSRLATADSADVFMVRREAFDDSPDLFVSGPDLSSPVQVSETNPFQSEYAWGRAEVVRFESETGRPLQGGLLYPAGYREGQRYPMIVYTYERLTPGMHRYIAPSERSYYNFTAWTQQGYFVLLPDIVYRWRDPGLSALEAVRPAVARVVEMGLVDPGRVGLIGHSWGGYQATFLPTRTDIFAASVAGAPLTDFVSFMGALHWNPGMPELSHWETGQARMEVPYWEDVEAHHRNSPIHKVHEMETPLLMAFGNEDGVVDWDQGTEFYNFARRAGKQMVLLVYEGEDHGFRRKPNQIDYHRRILEWFGHYLKGEPAPGWITEGVAADAIEDEARRVAGGEADGVSSREDTGR